MALPRTLGELQLYRILQRANLLCYYEAFIQQGGDDVQQLCEAGEEEFLEIMALVGMASKPLHVRRLQKALRDWVTNPALFTRPLASLPVSSIPIYKLAPDGSPTPNPTRDLHLKVASACVDSGRPASAAESERSLSPGDPGSPSSPQREGLEALDAAAVRSVAECVERLSRSLPTCEPAEAKEQLRGNKKLAKMIGHVFEMSDDDPRREEEVRKYSAIYGRFDSKRKDGKQLTLHELTVNEAAAQLCMKNLALLTRRDELFGMARQVSREVTYKYTYRHSRFRSAERDEPSPKRIKTEEGAFDLPEAMQVIYRRQESLKEQLAHAKSQGDESVSRHIQVQLDQLLARQMEMLHDAAAQERVQALECRVPHGTLNGTPENNTSEQQDRAFGERPLNLRVCGPRRSTGDGEVPLGKQLAIELKRRHSVGESRPREAPLSENGTGIDFSQSALNLSERKAIKVEPEDSR